MPSPVPMPSDLNPGDEAALGRPARATYHVPRVRAAAISIGNPALTVAEPARSCGVSAAHDDLDYQGGNIRSSPMSRRATNSHIMNFLFFMANSKSR